MDDTVIVSQEEWQRLDDMDSWLDQLAEDADGFGQSAAARIAREAAISIRRVLSRIERDDKGVRRVR